VGVDPTSMISHMEPQPKRLVHYILPYPHMLKLKNGSCEDLPQKVISPGQHNTISIGIPTSTILLLVVFIVSIYKLLQLITPLVKASLGYSSRFQDKRFSHYSTNQFLRLKILKRSR
jgi:hypothetical protein